MHWIYAVHECTPRLAASIWIQDPSVSHRSPDAAFRHKAKAAHPRKRGPSSCVRCDASVDGFEEVVAHPAIIVVLVIDAPPHAVALASGIYGRAQGQVAQHLAAAGARAQRRGLRSAISALRRSCGNRSASVEHAELAYHLRIGVDEGDGDDATDFLSV